MPIRYSLGALLALLLAGSGVASAQVVINEVDADTPGSDTAEFVELYNAGSAAVALDDYVVVFFNGNGTVSYGAYDLSGTLAPGAYYVLGNPGVVNVTQTFEPGSSGALQNGADAVALYTGSAADFPNGTAPSTTDLVDAIVYDTSDDDAPDLLAALGQTVQYNEDENGDKDNESTQRSPDGSDTIVAALATPGAANVGSSGATSFNALLRGQNEVPPVETDAKGGVTAVLDGTTLTVTGRFVGLSGAYAASHIHAGAAGANGPVVQALAPAVDADMRGGTFEASANTFTVRPTFADSIRAGLAYVNVHSAEVPSGEIRGQLGTQTHTLPFSLSGDNEVPPVATDATGSGSVRLDGATVTVTGSFSGLSGAYAASHIHAGAAGANGPVVQALAPAVDADMRGGTFEASANTFTVRPTFADSIRAGLAYVNVHSAEVPSGEIRGQIGTAVDMASGSIADARAQGVDATVTVEGTVTRTMGDFTYLQDETAGLTVRQVEGAFSDAVASGAIEPGTRLRVTGTLSEFANLLQINGDDLASFEILGTTDVPEPQVVTLNEISLDGETYEGELVTVQAVTIDPDGTDAGTDPDGTFMAASTYQIEDGSGAVGTVTLRIPNADDTSVDGTDIPEVADLTGIVSQFDFDSPVNGYQLLLLDADDVTPRGVATEADPAAALTLAVENPVRGQTAVQFGAGAPGQATLALFDVLGRRVQTLAAGPLGAGAQTATLDTAGLAAGVYVLRLDVDGATRTRTVTVLR
ncbi:CHRD domain-containing protein [Rubrivirga marina]|uniref:CHRD domain-containing protein n=1 Tax=Rubrivirga marina TaxID=1196024 RepID=A0A271IVK0_9BACT|nr:CHRD domain-containing protein [Rubrivirga marina]PAP75276.1 hypothetical protein BSZ37_01865 [Rubrivirga marina]